MAAQNAAGCADPLLDWLKRQTWFAGVSATIKLYLLADYAMPAAEAFDEEAIYVYELEEMAGRKRKNTPAAAKKEFDK